MKNKKTLHLNLGKGRLPRRKFLRGLGTAMALPFLDAMAPGRSLLAQSAGNAVAKAPLKLGFVYHPNGVIMDAFTPSKVGKQFDFPKSIKSLKPYRDSLQIVSGLAHKMANANGDGAGDHARANATFLTGAQARKTNSADLHLGTSIDQLIAEQIGRETKLPSLELSCSRRRESGSCDSGYSCAYQYNLSWKNAQTPIPPEVKPRVVFERMFENGISMETAENKARRDLFKKSILDFVLEDAHQLKTNLGRADRDKLDQYMESVREVEERIGHEPKFKVTERPKYNVPGGIPRDYATYIQVMFDMMTLAFQTNTTRIASFMLAHDGSNRPFFDLDISDGHHSLSHHQREKSKVKKVREIDQFYFEQFAYFLKKLQSIPDGPEATLLDNSMIVYGSGISDGNLHSHHNLPVLLAGKGGGSLNAGRHVKFDGNVPMTNLYLSLADKMGVQLERVGDSTSRLNNI